MIFASYMFRFRFGSIFCAKPVLVNLRYIHEVFHNPKAKTFFVPLDKSTKKAVLYYKINGKVMDLRAINVPAKYKGQGIAKLLTDTAFTYAIVNNHYLFLSCSYTQKYYLAHKNKQLEQRILGPQNVLGTSLMIDPDKFDDLPDPQDTYSGKKD